MARIIPADYKTNNDGLHESERQTLDYLEESLPNTWTVFSSVLWARSHAHYSCFGELDFCVVSPTGHLIVIEQKSGGMIERDGQLFKRYGITEKNAGAQLLRSISALKEAWKKQHQGETLALDYLLYLPDYRLKELNSLQLGASRVVHAGSRSLAVALEKLCDDAPPNDAKVAALHDFLTGVLELELDIGRLQSHQERFYRRHEDSLLAWVKRFSFSPYVLRVNGAAGAGKTQIGMGLFREAKNQDETARYICFNRPLADGLAQALSDVNHIQSRDHFYNSFLQEQGISPDYAHSNSELFAEVEKQVADTPIPEAWQTDLLIIDEGQDFPQCSLDVLRRFLRPGGRLIWLEDPEQNLYGHEPVILENAVTLKLDDCFRSPAAIVKALNILFPNGRQLIPANPHYGEEPIFHTVDRDGLADLLAQRIAKLCQQGISTKDIAIISLHGLQKSALHDVNQLGRHRISRFTGEYSLDGKQQWTSGDLVLDSIYRFKGSQRPFIFLIDADYEEITEREARLFYCGMTRATLGLEVFLSPGCETGIRKALEK